MTLLKIWTKMVTEKSIKVKKFSRNFLKNFYFKFIFEFIEKMNS